MKSKSLSRRSALKRAGVVGATVLTSELGPSRAAAGANDRPFKFCFNTATVLGQKLGIVKEVEIAAEAGYDSIEPWIQAIDEYVKKGGSLTDLRKRIADAGLTVESAIGFPEWVVNDDARRAKGVEQAKREMDMVAQIGGKRFAAPPAGATDKPDLNWLDAVERYKALLEAGDRIGIVPQLELWGGSKNLNRLGQCVGITMETGHPKACVLADVYHLYKGGSNYRGLRLLSADAIHVLHMNDYPAEPSREKIDDSHRVLPGDGIAPVVEILELLRKSGGQKVLSLEIFSRKYWKEDALTVAKAGLGKMKAVVEKVRT
jgi:2-keto-myo-inositol isomerase